MSEITPAAVKALLAEITPGPWHTSEHDPLEIWANRDPAGWDAFMVATVRTRLNPNGMDNGDPALIAAAPDIGTAYLAQAAEVERLRAALTAVLDIYRIDACVLDPENYCVSHWRPYPCPVGVVRRLLDTLTVDDPDAIRARAGEQP